MDWLVVTIVEDGDRSIWLRGLKFGLDSWTMWRRHIATSRILLLQQSTRALTAMWAAATLLLSDHSQVSSGRLGQGAIPEASLNLLLGLAKVYTFLLGMMRFVAAFSTLATDVCRPFLSLASAVLTLRDRTTFLRDERQLTVW
jgi:hypothetical protein